MAITKVGLNISALNNISSPVISFPTTASGFMTNLPIVANSITNGKLGYILFGGLYILLYLILSDKTPFREFGYSDLRSLTIASGIVPLFALTMIEIGYINNYKIVIMSTIVFMIGNIFLKLIESKQ